MKKTPILLITTISNYFVSLSMFIIYIVVVIPMGIAMKLLGRDVLHIKFDKSIESYWIKRDKPHSSMSTQL